MRLYLKIFVLSWPLQTLNTIFLLKQLVGKKNSHLRGTQCQQISHFSFSSVKILIKYFKNIFPCISQSLYWASFFAEVKNKWNSVHKDTKYVSINFCITSWNATNIDLSWNIQYMVQVEAILCTYLESWFSAC